MSSKNILIIFVIIIFISEVNVASAISLSISTDKSEYQYNDLLSFVIQVSDVTGKPLTLHIRDESGKNSAPIVLQIVNATTTITARESFDPIVYKPGVYYLDAEYSGAKASTSFKILSTDMIVIPSWIKNLGKWWSQELVTDKDFVRGIEYLIKEKIIIIPESERQDSSSITKIPTWIKTNAGWWADNRISDSDFALGIQYLIRNGIIIV
ncbi:MAG TPA: hypothetical protein VJJ25_00760 [Nitrosopumilaceae archaeon]|nr:hypothetical protein [Nitrosopumilaceae archaeon]